jgi:hypothetical protein
MRIIEAEENKDDVESTETGVVNVISNINENEQSSGG